MSHWRVATGQPLPFRNYDGDYVVFNPLSGSTHVLDIVSGEALVVVFHGVRSTDEVCEHVARFLEVPNDASVADSVQRVLQVLDDLGLIEPAPGC